VQAGTITKTEGAKIRDEPTTISMFELQLNHYMLPGRRRLSDKVTALFEPRHAKQYGRIKEDPWVVP